MDPRLVRISKSFRRSKTRFEVAIAIEHNGSGTSQQVADWTGLGPTRVEWALYGSSPPGFFRSSASLLTTEVLDEVVGRGGKLYSLSPLGVAALEEARRDPSFARPRARKVADATGRAGAMQV